MAKKRHSKKQQINYLKRRSKFAFKSDFDWEEKIDFESFVDSELCYEENLRRFIEEYKKFMKKDYLIKKGWLSSEDMEEEIRELNKKEFREYEKKQFEKIKESNKDIREYYTSMREKVKQTALGFSNGLIIKSRAGLGKSYQTIATLNELGLKYRNDYVVLNGYITPYAFYHFLFENREDKVIVIDDIEKLFRYEKNLGLLESALWSAVGKRFIRYHTTQKMEITDEFEFKSRLIILLNRYINEKNIKPIFSRVQTHTLNLKQKEIFEIMALMSKKDLGKNLREDEKMKVVEYIRNISKKSSKIDLRTFMKCLNSYKYAKKYDKDWKELVADNIEESKEYAIIIDLMNKYKDSVSKQVREFRRKTGKSRRTYFRRKRELRERVRDIKLP